MIYNLILYIVCYYKAAYVIILVVGVFVTARVSVHSGFGVDERIRATSRVLSTSDWLRLGVLLLLVITDVKLQVGTTWWPHWTLRLFFIG